MTTENQRALSSVFQRSKDGTPRHRVTVSRSTTRSRRSRRKDIHLDYDLLVNNVEKSIMADQERLPPGLTPQELMARSNPGLFDRDLTNPREVYSMLSAKPKPHGEDVIGTKGKNEPSKGAQTANVFPQLYRSASMKDIKRPNPKADKLGFYQSATELFIPRRSMNVVLLTRNRTSIEDFRRVDVSYEEKENLKTLNLPNITRIAVSQETGTQQPPDNVALPNVKNGHNWGKLREHDEAEEDKENGENTTSPKKKRTRIRDENGPPEAKLEKWFSEMPNEVFDKAQRAIMEESIKDKLGRYQQRRGKKEKTHNSSFIKSKRVPNTFLELRVDSFGRHLQVDAEKEKLSKYILQQKSLHKLKMREVEDGEKGHGDEFESPRIPFIQQRSHTTLTKKTIPEEKPKKVAKPSSPSKSLKTVNMNDVALNGALKANPRIVLSKFEEYNDRFNVFKSVPLDEPNQCGMENSTPPEKLDNHEPHYETTEADATERDLAKASIVNLALRKTTPKKRHPLHITQSMDAATTMVKECPDEQSEDGSHDSDSYDEQEDEEPRHKTGRIFATIPTAKSMRTSDSKSTSSSNKSQSKEVLKRFNRLEVFSENGPPGVEVAKPTFRGQRRRDTEMARDAKPLNYKLDLKQYPLRSPFTNGNLIQSEVRVQEVVFRFEPGEVFITKKNNLAVGRSSERARIIFGKASTKDDRKDDSRRLKEAHSMNSVKSETTKLDNYTSEMARFESRALADSRTSFDRPDEISGHRVLPTAADGEEHSGEAVGEDYVVNQIATPSVATVNTKGRLVKDMATETDVLGSEDSDNNPEGEESYGNMEHKGENAEVEKEADEHDYDIEHNNSRVPFPLEDGSPSGDAVVEGETDKVTSGITGVIEHEGRIVNSQEITERADSSVSGFIQNDDTGDGLDSDVDSKSDSISLKIAVSDRGTSAG